MTTVEVRTAELIGPALDWAVAKADSSEIIEIKSKGMWVRWKSGVVRWSPSTDWSQGGPLIAKYCISVIYAFEQFEALIGMTTSEQHESPLVSACRAVVDFKLGETVQVPEELLP